MVRRRPSSPSFDLFTPYDWFIPGWIDFMWVGILLIAGLILSAGVTISLNRAGFAPIYIQLISYPLLFIHSMLYASAMSKRNQFRIEPKPLDRSEYWKWPVALTAVLSILSAAILCDPISQLLPPMPESLQEALKILSEGPLWACILCTVVFAPFFEEWLCRGIILRGLLGKMRPAWAIALSALVFGLIHANLWQGLPAFLLALLLGFVYYKTGSLKLTMLMHAVNNLSSVLLMRLPGWDAETTFWDLFPSKGWYFVLLAAAAGILVFCLKRISRLSGQSHL